MRIGFVVEPYEEDGASGMGYFIKELLVALLKQNQGHEFTLYASQPVSQLVVAGEYRTIRIPRNFVAKLWWFFRMEKEVDLLLFVVPLLPLILPRSIHAIPICQELANLKFPPEYVSEKVFAFVRDRILMPVCFVRAERIVAASEATKEDIARFYGTLPERVTVISDGFQDLTPLADGAPTIDEVYKPFFFFAGKVKPRKNVHGIVSAFIKFKKRTSSPCKLLVAGSAKGEYYERLRQELNENGLLSEVHFLGYVTSPHLYALYTNALACVYPSLNEGFGMPVLEAMSLGTPVVTSNISSLPEVAGGAALLVDPFDTEDISRAMEKMYEDTSLRADLIQKGHARAKQFSWPKAAKAYLELLRSL
jgi:glycosyltransferase involved in cell wall biosynthesis